MITIPVIIPYFDDEEAKEVAEVLKTGWVAQGPKVAEFENLVCHYENVKYGVATTSCTTALHLALLSMGIGNGQDCIVPSFTFVATPNSVIYTGATPIFADVENDTYNISIAAIEKIILDNYDVQKDKLIHKKTGNTLSAIIAVSLFGLCADLPGINKIAEKYRIRVLQDSACAFGAKIGDRAEADFGNTTCLSFHPRKSITTGEGGMILTNDATIYETTSMLRSHGASVSDVARHKAAGYLLPDFDVLGYNYRMTDIQAAVGVAQMRKIDYIMETRRSKAHLYDKLIEQMNLDFLKAPFVPDSFYSTYQSYVCVLDHKKLGFEDISDAYLFRNELMGKLEEIGIATRVGTHATHMLGYYRSKYGFSKEDFPNSYLLDALTITLPLYVQMTDDDQKMVLSSIQLFSDEILGR